MSKVVNLEVVQCKETKYNTFYTKLVETGGSKVTVGGLTMPVSRRTFYVYLASPMDVGSTHAVDLDLFDIVKKPYTIEETGEEIHLSFLERKQ